MTTFSMFLFALVPANAAVCGTTWDTNTWQGQSKASACYCGNAPNDSADNCGSATGTACIDNVDGTKKCPLVAKCATTDGTAAGDYCQCAASATGAAGVDLCGPDGYCYTESAASGTKLAAWTCSNLIETKVPNLPKSGTAGAYVTSNFAKCNNAICIKGQFCKADDTCEGGDEVKASGDGLGDADYTQPAKSDGSLVMGSSTKVWCTQISVNSASAAKVWDVLSSDATNDRCYASLLASQLDAPDTDAKGLFVASNGRFATYGTPRIESALFAISTTTQCTAYKVMGPNEVCYASGKTGGSTNADVAIYCAGGAYWTGKGDKGVTAIDISTGTLAKINEYCVAAGVVTAKVLEPKLCDVHSGLASATAGCACAPNAGDSDAVQGGERGCPKASFCYAQGKDEGQTLQGKNTCMALEADQCDKIAGSNAGSIGVDGTLGPAAMNGTIFTMEHSATTGHGQACFCGDKICGAGRACISANATGWTGVKADGANGAAAATKSFQCLSAAIDHCPGANGTVQLDTFLAGRADPWKIDAGSAGSNKACYCDAGETTICGAGRYCLNNTATGFTGSAECLSSHLVHCTNYTGFTAADEACTCSDSLTCGEGQYCVNGTHFTDDTKPAECLAAQIAPCVNWTKALGANTHSCTCGKDVCAAGQSCDSNTTCTTGPSTPAPTGTGSSAGYEKPAMAFLTVAAVLFSALY